MKNITLSKNPFIKGAQCTKATYLHYNHPEYKSAVSIEQQLMFDKGKGFGLIAHELYSEGEDLSMNCQKFGSELIESTKLALKSGKRILYEAAFESDENFIMNNGKMLFNGKIMFVGDIIVISEKKIKIIEVKSSTIIKTPDHVYDIGFQSIVLENCSTFKNSGDENKRIEFWIAYINNQ